MKPFEIAGGSITGRLHARAGRNNQDAFAWRTSAAGTVLVVCDGCGSEPHSEVGARLGAALLVEAIVKRLGEGASVDQAIEEARGALVLALRAVATGMGSNLRDAVYDHFLFTIVGAVVGAEETIVFALGDGAAWLNGEPIELATFAGNAPPYLGYALLEDAFGDLTFKVLARARTASLQTLALGTDGLHDWVRNVGPAAGVDAFFTSRVFTNRDMVRRELARASRAPETSLPDDTTLVVLRRAPNANAAGPS